MSEAWGDIAVSWPGRRSAWHAVDWRVLTGRRVVVLSAATNAARARSAAIASHLHGLGVVELRIGLPSGTDRTGPAEWIETLGKAAARDFIGRLLEPFEPPATPAVDTALQVSADADPNWIDTNSFYRTLGSDEDRAAFRLSNGQVYRPRADRLTVPATLIRLAPRAFWCAHTGEEKLTADGGRAIGDVLTRAVDRRGPYEIDPDPDICAVPGGRIVELRSGELRPATEDGDSYVMSQLGAVPEKGSPDVWLRSLDDLFGAGHPEAIPWLQRWLGYCLTGHTREHRFLLMVGPSGTGKSTLQRVIERVGGSYYKGVNKRGLFGEFSDHTEHLARLRGARVVIADDVPAHGWRVSDIKSLVSGETITARDIGAGSKDFESTVKLIMSANALPEIPADQGINRRIMPLTMDAFAPDDNTRRSDILRELPRIVAWAIEGAVQWYRDGLGSTSIIDAARIEFARIGDKIGTWLTECCELAAEYEASTQELLASYGVWAKTVGGRPISARRMHTYFSYLDGSVIWPKTLRDGQRRGFGGVRLRFTGSEML